MSNTKKWVTPGTKSSMQVPTTIKDATMFAAMLIDKDDPEMMALLRKRNAERRPLGEFAAMI